MMVNPWLTGGLGIMPSTYMHGNVRGWRGLRRGKRCKSLRGKGGTFFSGRQEEGAR